MSNNPQNQNFNPMQMMSALQQNGGIEGMMLQDSFQDEQTGHTFSQADIVADVINILRLDTKRIAEEVGVEITIDRCTPEKAAELLVATAQGSSLELIEVFDQVGEDRMQILDAVSDEPVADEWELEKLSMLYSATEESAQHLLDARDDA